MPIFVEIAVNVPRVSEVFHYHLPPELEDQVQVGHLVVIPFGRQTVQGVVLRFIDQPEVPETRPVYGLIQPPVRLTSAQLAFATHLSDKYLAPLATCITLMLPPGLGQQSETVYTRNLETPVPGGLRPMQKRLLSLLEKRGPLRTRQIERFLRNLKWQPAAQALVRNGLVTTQTVLPEPNVRPKVVRTAQLGCSPAAAERAMPDLAQPLRTVRLACPPAQALSEMDNLARAGSKALDRRQALLRYLVENPEPVEVSKLYAATGCSTADLDRLGKMDLVDFGEAPSETLKRRQAILRFLIQEPEPVEVAWLYAESGGNLQDLYMLAERGLVVLGESEVWRNPLSGHDFQQTLVPPLTRAQLSVWNELRKDLRHAAAGQPVSPVLLHGVTGSGKTEIYLHAVAETMRMGRQAIVLVPEIALTPQTIRRFASRFPGQIGLLHSGLSDGERYDTWRRARAGEISVVVGPRSALFTPFPNLGLIVVDESHDDSYYQDESLPHYHAREAAVVYARQAGAVCLLGSATPDITSTYCASQGEWRYLHLPARILAHRQAVQAQIERLRSQGLKPEAQSHYRALEGLAETTDLPQTRLVDMRQELQAGNRSIFSRALQTALEETLSRSEQAILFLNRRGTATYVFCRDCGASLKCPRCDIPLTYHRPQQALLCHRCGYQRNLPDVCPACGSDRIRQYGTGTARVESELHALFPQVRTLRWDHETTRQKGAHEAILNHFSAQHADVLVGTQMLAKGLDLPLVTLVGVVLADVGLNLPDYRAAERTFQVLTQVAGRAGRSPLGGQVILQTFQPDQYAIQAAASHNYKVFYQQELEYRRQLGYPPFTQLVRLECRRANPNQAERAAQEMAAQLRSWLADEDRRATQIIGPAPAFFARLAGLYRWQIVLRGPNPASILRNRSLGEWKVEVDPPNLL